MPRRADAESRSPLFAKRRVIRGSLRGVYSRRGVWSSFVGESLDLLNITASIGAGSVLRPFSVFVFRYDARDSGNEIAFVEIDEFDPLRDTTCHSDLRHRATNDHTMFCDDHDFIRRQNFHQRNDIAGFFGSVNRDDALATAFLDSVIPDVGTLAKAVFRDHKQRCITLDNDHANDGIALAQLDTLAPGCVASHLTDVLLVEANRQAVTCCEHDVIGAARHLHVDQLVTLLDLDCLDSRRANVGILRQRGLFDRAVARAEQQELSFRELTHRHHRLDLRLGRDVDQVDDWFALGRAARLRNLINLQPEASAVVGEAEDVVVRRTDKEMLDEILILESCPAQSTTTATLLAIRRVRRALDVTRVGNGDDHVLLGDQILDGELAFVTGDLGAAVVTVLVGD